MHGIIVLHCGYCVFILLKNANVNQNPEKHMNFEFF
jgi:hypothetical protein